MNVVDNKKANIETATSMIIDSANNDADFIVLPEMFNCPYSNDKFIEYGVSESESDTLKSISKLASENHPFLKRKMTDYIIPVTCLTGQDQ